MVLPIEYTNGLEFDAVLIYNPTSDSYPPEDAYVKLLYVAATRVLHELAVLHTGKLTDLIGKPAPKRSQIRLPESEGIPETAKPAASPQKLGSILKTARSANLPVNPSPFRFGSIPDGSLLKLGKDHADALCCVRVRIRFGNRIRRDRHVLRGTCIRNLPVYRRILSD